MIYVVMAIVLGYAGWQLYKFFRKVNDGGCGGGCAGCGSNGNCSIQSEELIQVDLK
jgi:hypothetical protein